MNNLIEALIQLRMALTEMEDPTGAVTEAATDYGLHPELVRRKFTEANGCAPDEWQRVHRANQERLASLRDASMQRAQDKARQIARDKWDVQGTAAELAGRVFKMGDKKYAWIVYCDSPNDKWAIRALDTDTHRVVTLHRNDWVEIMAQIAPDVRVI